MSDAAARHGRACAGFSAVVGLVRPDQWGVATPCSEWDARGVVEHVIGFHEFLLLRPVGVRADRPRDDPARRWQATEAAIGRVLAISAVLDRPVEYFDGGTRPPREMLGALTTDVLVHTWDLARAVGVPDGADPALWERALRDARRSASPRQAAALFGPEVPVPDGSDAQACLLGLLGRDPSWLPPAAAPR